MPFSLSADGGVVVLSHHHTPSTKEGGEPAHITLQTARQRGGNIWGKGTATLTTIDIENSENTALPTTKRAVTNDGPGEVGIIRSKIAPHFAPYLTTIQGEINMSLEANFGRYVKGVQYASMTLLLRDFVRELEHQHGGPVSTITINAAEVISDFCRYLGLSDENRHKVLGVDGAQHVALVEHATIQSTVKH